LNIAGNLLASLPKEIGNLKYMEIMDLNGCALTELPEEFPGMIRYYVYGACPHNGKDLFLTFSHIMDVYVGEFWAC